MNYRPLVLSALCFGAGIALGKELQGRGLLLLFTLIVCFAITAFLIRYKRAAFALIALLLGIIRVSVAYPDLPIQGECQIYGKICDVPRYEYESWEIVLSDAKVDGRKISGRVKLKFDDKDRKNEFCAGDVIEVSANISHPKGATNEGQPDKRHSLLSKGISVTALSNQLISRTHGKQDLQSFILKARNAVNNNIEKLYPENAEMVKGILLGSEGGMDENMLKAFRDTGLSHILSVSGLHVVFFVTALSFILKSANATVRFFVIGLFLLIYCAITAFPESLVRAAVMTILMLFAGVIGRRNDPPTSLAAAFIFILIINPFQLFSAGFQLSFGAVAGMLLMYKPFFNLLKALFPPLRESLAVSASASIGTLPITLVTFNRLPLYSIFSNVLAVPLSSLALIPALLAVIICFASFQAALPIAAFSNFMLELMKFTIKIVSVAPYGVLKLPSPSFVLCAGFSALMLFVSPYMLIKPSWKRKGAVLIALLLMISAVVPVLSQPDCTITVLDETGCAPIHMRLNGRNYILDTGGMRGIYSLSCLLDHRGITVVEGVAVVSISDAAAVTELSKQIEVRKVFVFSGREDILTVLKKIPVTIYNVKQNESLVIEEDTALRYEGGLVLKYKDFLLCTENVRANATVRVVTSGRKKPGDSDVVVYAGGSDYPKDEFLLDKNVFSTREKGEILINISDEKLSFSTLAGHSV